MYNAVESMDEGEDYLVFIKRLEEISKDFMDVSISKQAIFTHWLTHIGFFYRMQTKWVVNELKLTHLER